MAEHAANDSPPPPPGRRGGIPLRGAWLAATGLLGLTAVGLALFVALRSPEVIEQAAPAPAANPPSPEATRRADALRQLNGALAAQVDGLQAELAKPVVCPPGSMLKKDAAPQTPAKDPTGGAEKGNLDQSAAGDTPIGPLDVPPGNPDVAVLTPPPPPATGEAKVLPTAQLTQALERATALVLTADSTATGFFVDDRLLLTNRHAVETAQQGKVLLASASLAQVRRGTVVASSPPGQPGSPDFALVRLDDGTAPGFLTLTTQYGKLMRVVAAGYPFFSIEKDAGFQRLASGDARAAPDLNVTTGTVQATIRTPQGARAIVHEAAILRGNSGGPLVDGCGRVIGINTFIAVDQEQSARNNYALAAEDLLGFLKQAKAPVRIDSRACAG